MNSINWHRQKLLSIILTVYLYRQLSFSNKRKQNNHTQKKHNKNAQTKIKEQTSLGYLINKACVLKEPKGPCAQRQILSCYIPAVCPVCY